MPLILQTESDGTVRLGLGEFAYVDPDQDPARKAARDHFLEVVAEKKPEVLTDLRDLALPVYSRCLDEAGWDGTREELFHSWQALNAWTRFEAGADLVRMLKRWARKHHLNGEWILDAAALTIAQWHGWQRREAGAELRDNPQWRVDMFGWHAPDPDQDRFMFTPRRQWDPLAESKKKARARIRDEFDRTLDAHMERLDIRYEKARDKNGQRVFRRVNNKHSLTDQVSWLVEYQVCELKISQVAGRASRTASAMHESINNAAKYLGIRLRKTKVGRPKATR